VSERDVLKKGRFLNEKKPLSRNTSWLIFFWLKEENEKWALVLCSLTIMLTSLSPGQKMAVRMRDAVT
jgi:hypothetical protein